MTVSQRQTFSSWRTLPGQSKPTSALAASSERDLLSTQDLPQEISKRGKLENTHWDAALKQWARQQLSSGRSNLMNEATPTFEKVMIAAALEKSGGKRQEAAMLLGWGRNTLTRKIRDLDMEEES